MGAIALSFVGTIISRDRAGTEEMGIVMTLGVQVIHTHYTQ